MRACRRDLAIAYLSFAAATLAIGCGKAEQQDGRRASGIMTVLGLEYGDYLATHRNAPPAELAQFRTFIESRPQKMAEYRVASIDDLFTSPRDSQPIQVVCGVAKPVLDAGGFALAAYEATGVDGKRLVANIRGGVSELSAADFAQTFPNDVR